MPFKAEGVSCANLGYTTGSAGILRESQDRTMVLRRTHALIHVPTNRLRLFLGGI